MIHYEEYYKYPVKAVFMLTNNCNLCCKYCFVEQHPENMPLSVAIDAVELLIKNHDKLKELNQLPEDDIIDITFFGGEPMLRYKEVIVPLIEYIYTNNYQDLFNFSMTTNGTLLNKEIIDFLIDHKTTIMISCDGVQEAQDYNRPFKNSNRSSYEAIIDNIKYLASKQRHVIFRPTLIPDTVHTLFDTYLLAESLGCDQFFSMPNHRQNWPEEKIEVLKEQLSKICHYILNQLKNGIIPYMRFGPFNAGFTNILYQDIYKNLILSEKNDMHHCGLGIGTWTIGVDGKIYGCQEQPSKDEKNIFHIGNIWDGLDENRHNILLETFINSKKPECINKKLCDKCPITIACKMQHLTCPSTIYDLRKNFYQTEEIECIWVQEIVKNCLTIMSILSDENNLAFTNFLKYQCDYEKILNVDQKKQERGDKDGKNNLDR